MDRDLRFKLETFFTLKHGTLKAAYEYYEDNKLWDSISLDDSDAIKTGYFKESLRESGSSALTRI